MKPHIHAENSAKKFGGKYGYPKSFKITEHKSGYFTTPLVEYINMPPHSD